MLRLILGGGGGEDVTGPLDERFSRWLNGGRLLYLPTALVRRPNMVAGAMWVGKVYGRYGVNQIDTWYNLKGRTAQDLSSYAGIYIGGGNTFYLLDQIRKHGLADILRAFVLSGGAVYGGSAGGILLSANIDSCAHIDEDIVGITDRTALNLLDGWLFWCHYEPAHALIIRAYVARTGIPSVAVTERAGIIREGERILVDGFDPAVVFTPAGEWQVAVGDEILLSK